VERRELLRMIALLTGGVVVGGEVFLTGCTTGAKPEAGFTAANIALLDEVGETILPATSSPGAKDAKVGEFMKVYVTDCYSKDSQDTFMKGITELDEACKKMHSKSFMECTPEQRKELLLKLEIDSKSYNKVLEDKDKPGREAARQASKEYDFIPSTRHYYTMMKQLTLLGFFTSQPGATQALRHVAVPQKYDGAFPYKKGDKAFSS
jgi:Gluconate 2-dehydrogenase subunit 3